jgi:hypothetical protein
MYIGFHVEYLYSSQIWKGPEFSRQILEKYSKIKFLKNLSNGTGLFHADGGQTGKQTDMTKLIVAFLIFANTFKNCMKGHKSIVTVDHLQRNS